MMTTLLTDPDRLEADMLRCIDFINQLHKDVVKQLVYHAEAWGVVYSDIDYSHVRA